MEDGIKGNGLLNSNKMGYSKRDVCMLTGEEVYVLMNEQKIEVVVREGIDSIHQLLLPEKPEACAEAEEEASLGKRVAKVPSEESRTTAKAMVGEWFEEQHQLRLIDPVTFLRMSTAESWNGKCGKRLLHLTFSVYCRQKGMIVRKGRVAPLFQELLHVMLIATGEAVKCKKEDKSAKVVEKADKTEDFALQLESGEAVPEGLEGGMEEDFLTYECVEDLKKGTEKLRIFVVRWDENVTGLLTRIQPYDGQAKRLIAVGSLAGFNLIEIK